MNILSYIGGKLRDDFICAEEKVHDKLVEDVDCSMPDEAVLCELSELFRVFGDSTRIRILYALSRSEMCVCDLSKLLGVSQSAISHQLQLLRSSRLVKYRREGKTVFYSLDDEHLFSIINIGLEHLEEY